MYTINLPRRRNPNEQHACIIHQLHVFGSSSKHLPGSSSNFEDHPWFYNSIMAPSLSHIVYHLSSSFIRFKPSIFLSLPSSYLIWVTYIATLSVSSIYATCLKLSSCDTTNVHAWCSNIKYTPNLRYIFK